MKLMRYAIIFFFIVLPLFVLPPLAHPSTTSENNDYNSFISYLKTSFNKSIRRFTAGYTGNICKPDAIPKPKKIDGIVRVDTSEITDTNCVISLPKPFPAERTATDNYTLSPFHASYIADFLIRSREVGDINLVKDILDNFFYEIKNFGYPIAKNHGLFLTRSENNIIPSNIRSYFEASKNYNWLENEGIPNAKRIIEYWNTRIGVIPLSKGEKNDNAKDFEANRWIAHGSGPDENIWNNHKEHDFYYFKVLNELVRLGLTPDPKRPYWASGFDYNRVVDVFSTSKTDFLKGKNALIKIDLPGELSNRTYILKGESSSSGKDQPVIEIGGVYYSFTPKYFSNDRAARASAYIMSHIYGPWGSFTDEFVDVSLNTILYKANLDLAKMYDALAKKYETIDRKKHDDFREQYDLYIFEADKQKDVIMTYMFNNELGMFFNYCSHTHTQRVGYPFAASGYAIWAGLLNANDEKEAGYLMQVVDYMSKILEGDDGYYASNVETGLAWDKPAAPAIVQAMIVGGLKRYAEEFGRLGRNEDAKKLVDTADRIAMKYISANLNAWKKSGGRKLLSPNGDETSNYIAILDLYNSLSTDAKGKFKKGR